MNHESPRTPLNSFRNHPPRRLFLKSERAAFQRALDAARLQFGREYRPRLDGAEVSTLDVAAVPNPSHPDGNPVGYVHNNGAAETARALQIAAAAFPAWSARPLAERCAILRRAATRLAERRDEVAGWAVHEAAKAWAEALADVDEAIDYLTFYALAAESIASDWQAYEPRGVVAVIPPWNFPVAIPCGMTSAALVMGNTVILKPAEQTPIVAYYLVQVLHEAGVPEEVLIWLPGRGEIAGAALVSSSSVDMVAFTGSRAVGTAIYKAGAAIIPERGGIRATVAEMGGKNPIVVFPDADLDEAVIDILRSAFGHANQKCSASSRILVHRDIFDRLRRRLVEGARSLAAGPADLPGTVITPLIDRDARDRVQAAGDRAATEGRLLLDDRVRPEAPGVVGPLIVEIPAAASASAATTQEEIFGPVLALIPFAGEDQAASIANNTPYALTAGILSRSPRTIARMVDAIDAGNVYVNRPTTGARVGVEPFGGHKLSGTGPKAGSRDYLWAFVRRRQGYRAGEPRPPATATLSRDAVQPWTAPPRQRARTVGAAVARLRGPWRDRWAEALTAAGATADSEAALQLVDALLARAPEIYQPEPTLFLPGQHTSVRWNTPRGCGLVLVDAGATFVDAIALTVAPLLAGNGILVLADPVRQDLMALVCAALQQSGAPVQVVGMAPPDLDLAIAIAMPQITFAAVDASDAQTRAVYRLLAGASGSLTSPHLKALIALVDGPSADQPGFLRRFALPKTVAVRTLHLGAELELPDSLGP